MVSFLMDKVAASIELDSPSISAEVKNKWSYTPALLLIGLHAEKRDNITFTFQLWWVKGTGSNWIRLDFTGYCTWHTDEV